MMPEFRSPFAPLQAATFARCREILPTFGIFSVVPDHSPYPYIYLGAFTDKPRYDTVDTIVHEVTYAIQFWARGESTAEIDNPTKAILAGITLHPLELADDWKVLETAVDEEIYEVDVDEFGHVLHGTMTVRFQLEDRRT